MFYFDRVDKGFTDSENFSLLSVACGQNGWKTLVNDDLQGLQKQAILSKQISNAFNITCNKSDISREDLSRLQVGISSYCRTSILYREPWFGDVFSPLTIIGKP